MWMINCCLLIIGTVAAVCGLSFYLRNREATGNIRFYIFLYGICAAIWCLFFGLIGFCDDMEACRIFRKAGDVGVVSFLITETFLITDISGARKLTARIFKILAVVAGIADYFIFSQDNVNTFVRIRNWTTWTANPDGAFNREFHSAYILFTFLVLFSFGIVWMRNNRVKRLRRFLYIVFAANFTMLFFTIPDTFLPAMGRPAVSTSGIGAAVCAIVMWYGATQLGSFDIRMGNIRDRLFDFIEAGVLVLDVDGRIAVMNRYSKKLAGSDLGETSRLTDFFDITGEMEKDIFVSSVDSIYMGRLWNRERTGAYSLRLSAVKDSFGEVFCYICVYVDVTEEVEAVSRFEVASRAKSTFLAQMSHEIRTPINAVLGMNEMILRRSDDKEIMEYARNVASAGNTLLTLINSILDFSKIEDGKMDIIPVRYDTASLINDLYHSIAGRADAKGLEFIMDVDENLPCAMVGDDVRVSQVIMNLLTNAVKYTEKGSVTFSIKAQEKSGEDIDVFVSVKDTGIGIREEDLSRLSLSFERLDEVRNHNIEGTGLGISIVTSLLSMMESSLRVESRYGEGSLFYFVIRQRIADGTPIGDYEKRLKEAGISRKKEDVVSAPSAKVLVVDDNEMNLKVARNLLMLCNIKPDEAASGLETIEKMRRSQYDIVFLDHMMPGMDGIETLKQLKEEKLIPRSTVMIMLTANAVVGARESYLEAGFSDYLSKPIKVKTLVEKLKTYLPEGAYDALEAEKEATSERIQGTIAIEASGADEIMEFAPDAEDEIFEFQPDEEDGSEHFRETDSRKGNYDIEKLSKAGIDTAAGLNYCAGDKGLYFEMLGDFVSALKVKLDTIDSFFREDNRKEYEVAVHALKSNARTIGANDLYEQARCLEEAAERGDTEYIKENHKRISETGMEIANVIRKSEILWEDENGIRE